MWHLGLLLNQEGSTKGKLSASGKLRPIKQTIYCFLLHKHSQRIVFSLFIWNFTRFVELETLDFIYEPSSHLSLIWTINSLVGGENISMKAGKFSKQHKITYSVLMSTQKMRNVWHKLCIVWRECRVLGKQLHYNKCPKCPAGLIVLFYWQYRCTGTRGLPTWLPGLM